MAGEGRDGNEYEVVEGDLVAEDELATEHRLALDGDDEALPWLESDDEPQDEGFDARLIIFALLGVVVLAGLLFAIWSFTRGGSDEELLAEGSTIEAPDAPYKTRPEDPGGEEVAGTGDLSFEVGEGEGREGQIASDAPQPSIDRQQADAPARDEDGDTDEAPAPEPQPTASTSGVAVQVGAFSTRAAADAAWSQFAQRFSALSGMSHRVVEGRADSGTIYRLQAIAGSRAAAGDVCRSIRREGGDCQVK